MLKLSSPPPPWKYLDKEVADAPEPVRETGLVLAEPVVVGDAAVVHLLHELGVLPVHQHLVQALAAALLHPLEAELEVDWQLNTALFIALEGVDPTKNWALLCSHLFLLYYPDDTLSSVDPLP